MDAVSWHFKTLRHSMRPLWLPAVACKPILVFGRSITD